MSQNQSQSSPVYVSLEFTPNPNTLKYSVNRELLSKGARNFTNLDQARGVSPLAEKLFALDGIAGVMIGKDFVTITKGELGDWDAVHKSASKALEQHLQAGEVVLNEDAVSAVVPGAQDSEIDRKIRAIIDSEIRPAVAMDGGDITFERFENGIVYLQLQGSCSGCPSASMTLKMGIETKLKQAIPEVQEVVSV